MLNEYDLSHNLPVMTPRIPYSTQTIHEDDRRAVLNALDHKWLAGDGPIVHAFEDEIAEFTGYRYAIAVNSATSGLFAAARFCLHPGVGNTFTVPALTFVATANVIKAAGWNSLKIEIVDVDPATLVRNGCDIGVSYAGYPVSGCVINDDAHSLFKNMGETKTGGASVISLHPVKPITAGEGGVILTHDEHLYMLMRAFTNHGKNEGRYKYGHNFRMPSLNAALARSQLTRAESDLQKRQEIASVYYQKFRGHDWIRLPPAHPRHSWHLFVIRTRMPRELLRGALSLCGIDTQVHYPPLYTYPHINSRSINPNVYPITQEVWEHGLSIPMYTSLGVNRAAQVADIILAIHDRWRLHYE